MSPTIDLTDVVIQLEQIQAMIYCARQTIAAEKSHDCSMTVNLLMAADNRISALKDVIVDAEAV